MNPLKKLSFVFLFALTSLANAQAAWQLHPLELSRAVHAIAQDAIQQAQ